MLALVSVPPKIEEDGQSLSKVIVGDEVELPCNVTGIPRPRIIWQKGTRILSGGMPGGCSMLELLGCYQLKCQVSRALRNAGEFQPIHDFGFSIHQI